MNKSNILDMAGTRVVGRVQGFGKYNPDTSEDKTMEYEIRFFERNSHDIIGDNWAWIAVKEGKPISALTVRPIMEGNPDIGSHPERAQVIMVATDPLVEGKGVARCVVKRAINDLSELHELKLFRSGLATEGGEGLLESLGVTIDPGVLDENKNKMAEISRWEAKYGRPYPGSLPPIRPYDTYDAHEKRTKCLSQAAEVLGYLSD